MDSSQTFEILRRAGGIRAARIITDAMPDMSWLRVRVVARKLRRGVPVAKIIHKKWFFGLAFYTNRHTLDPRPDTETLVAAVISDVTANTAPRILDLGTGTGCIAISLVKNIHGATAVAVDRSRGAIRVARRNVRDHNLMNAVTVRRGDFTHADMTDERFDIIVSNPPYIARGDGRVDAGAAHDPDIALYASNNGYAAYETIAKNAKNWLCKGGNLYLEIGIDMGPRIKKIFSDNDWEFCRAEKDLGGVERVLVFTKSA